MVYTITKTQDKYYIQNSGATSITITLEVLENCVEYDTVYSKTVPINEEIEITFSKDGDYNLTITDGTDTVEVPFKYYLNLELSMIDSIQSTICNCKCNCGCEDTDMCKLLMTRAKIDAYKRLINPQAVSFFDAINKHVKCLITKPIYCSLAEESIFGEANCNENFIKQLIALDYLALYYFEYMQEDSTEGKDYVETKFKQNKIFCCIQKLGINILEIEQLIKNNMGTFTITSAAYINQAPSSIGDYSLSVSNRAVSTLTLAMFTTDTTPAYADPEGDAAASVRIDTLPADGILYLDGVAVIAGQEISVADINSNLLTYESPDQDALDSDTFEFSIADAGSGLYSS